MKLVRTKRLKIPGKPIYSSINAYSAEVWQECSDLMDGYQWQRGYGHAHHDFYIGEDCEGWMDKNLSKSQPLHSQSIQSVRQSYFKSWKSYSVLKKTGGIEKPKPPHQKKQFRTTRWLKSAIKFIDTKNQRCVSLSMGAGRNRLEIDLPKDFDMSETHRISTIDLVYDYGKWELHFTYSENVEKPDAGDGVIGVDIGEIHPIVSNDGRDTHIYNGRYIRSLYRHRNKVMSNFNQAISRCKRHSKRWWKLTRRKWRHLRKIDNQIRDGINKHTSTFVKHCVEKGIGTIVLGDLRGIRRHIDYGKKSNQKLHQWAFGKITQLITYKAKALGIKVDVISEAYTSQTCPRCGNRKKPTNRNYTCECGFKYHRDGVGAMNIRAKYLGCFGTPVVADTDNRAVKMTPPRGFRLKVPVASL